MKNIAKNFQKKLIISFSGCTKKDKGKEHSKDGGKDLERSVTPIKNSNYESKNTLSQLTYKF